MVNLESSSKSCFLINLAVLSQMKANAAAPSKTPIPPASVPCWTCDGNATFVLEEVDCEVVGAEVGDWSVLSGANVGTAEALVVEATAEQLSHP